MKILLFSYKFYPDVGGIESISKMLAQYFMEAGHEVRLITTSKSNGQNLFPFKVIRNPGLTAVISELKWADIVYENNPCFSLSYPNFFIRKPSVISLQTWLESLTGKYNMRQKFKHAFLRWASKVVACSNAIQTTFPEAVVIPNPYNEKLFKIKPGISKTRDFIFLGRLVSDKGADMAVKAIYQLLRLYPATNLTIVGNGEEIMMLKKMVQDLNIQWEVHFTGILQGEELADCLNEHRYLLVPSLWREPFGIVVLEGLACGCIPIVADGGGLHEAAGGEGLSFKRGSLDGLVKCMTYALQNFNRGSEINNHVKEHLHAHEAPVIAREYLQIFETVIKKGVEENSH